MITTETRTYQAKAKEKKTFNVNLYCFCFPLTRMCFKNTVKHYGFLKFYQARLHFLSEQQIGNTVHIPPSLMSLAVRSWS